MPMISHLVIPGDCRIVTERTAVDIFHEAQKTGIRVEEDELLQEEPKEMIESLPGKIKDPDGYGAENLKEDAMDPSTYSKLTDSAHQGFQVALGSRFARIIKIALHIIKTPQDENPDEDPNKNWSVVPDKPSSSDEKEGIEYFKTRDEAAAFLNKKPNIAGTMVANDLSEWFEPDEAADVAWSFRKSTN